MTTLSYRGYAITVDKGQFTLSINPTVTYPTYEQITKAIDLLIKAKQSTNDKS